MARLKTAFALLATTVVVILAGCGQTPPATGSGERTPAGGSSTAPAPSSSPGYVTAPGSSPTPTSTPVSPPAPSPSPASASPSVAGPTGSILFYRERPEGTLNGSYWIVAAAGGTPHRLGPGVEAEWASDGSVVHVVRFDPRCVPVVVTKSPVGATRSTIHRGLRPLDQGFSWSPDGRYVTFLRYHYGAPRRACGSQGGTYTPHESLRDLMIMRADGTGLRVLLPRVHPSLFASWSPDSRRFAVSLDRALSTSNRQQLVVVDVPSGHVTDLDPRLGIKNVEALADIHWSPSGRDLAFTMYANSADHAAVAPISGGRIRDLGVPDIGDYAPSWAPDGGSLAFARDRVQGNEILAGTIIVVSMPGLASRDLGLTDVQGGVAPPAWSPDGRWLAYVRVVDAATGGLGGIVVIGADGHQARTLGGTRDTDWIAWQPER